MTTRTAPRKAASFPGVESPEARAARLSSGGLTIFLGLLLLLMAFTVNKSGSIALSDAFATKKLPVLEVPGTLTLVICSLLALGGGVTIISGLFRDIRHLRVAAGILAATGVLVGLIVWAAASSTLPFTLSSQLNLTLEYSTPLFFGVLCGVLSERAGVVNIAIEGQFLTAAFAASLTYSMTQSYLAALTAAALAGLVMAGVLAVFTLKYLVDHVVIGVVINLLATGLTGFIFQQLVSPNLATYGKVIPMQSFGIPFLENLAFIGPVLFVQKPLSYLGIILIPIVWSLLYRTKWGLRVRSVGEHPHAADAVGINVVRVKSSAVLLGGALAGLGGAYFTIGSIGAFQDNNLTAGNGFIALAAVIMGRWHPITAACTALFFGFTRALAQSTKLMQLPIPSDFIEMLPYLATIIAVAGLVGRVRPPAADGAHFVKSQ